MIIAVYFLQRYTCHMYIYIIYTYTYQYLVIVMFILRRITLSFILSITQGTVAAPSRGRGRWLTYACTSPFLCDMFSLVNSRLAFLYLEPHLYLHKCTFHYIHVHISYVCIYIQSEMLICFFLKWVKVSFAQQLSWPTFARCVLFVKDLRQPAGSSQPQGP